MKIVTEFEFCFVETLTLIGRNYSATTLLIPAKLCPNPPWSAPTMKSLKGFVLKELISAENEQTTEVHHPVKGNSMKIGSSFVCHLVFKGLNLVHFEISLNETNQVSVS